jgi:hypothetical protein
MCSEEKKSSLRIIFTSFSFLPTAFDSNTSRPNYIAWSRTPIKRAALHSPFYFEKGVTMATNRIQEVKKAHPLYLDLALEIADPSHKNKYLMWIASQLANKHSQEDIKVTVGAFHKDAKRLNSSDIYSYKDLKDLEDEIKNLDLSKRQVEIYSKEMGAVKIFGDDNCSLIRINSKNAMLYYGKASRWCIAMADKTYWEEYSSSGNTFYVLLDKTKQRKFCIQKEGMLDVTIWEEDDDEVDNLNEWVKKNNAFEAPVFACLYDREDPMMYKIKRRTTNKQEVSEWLKYQHQNTINFMKKSMRGSCIYLVDTSEPITTDTLDLLSNIPVKDMELLKSEDPKFIEDIVVFLISLGKKEPGRKKQKGKTSFHTLRKVIGNLIECPERILSEDEANFIKMKTDPSIAEKLLSSSNLEMWTKALNISSPVHILASIPKTKGEKRSCFIRKLASKTDFGSLFEWMADEKQAGKPIPDIVWRSRASNDYNDECDNDCDECDED